MPSCWIDFNTQGWYCRQCLQANHWSAKLQYNAPGSFTCKHCAKSRGTGPDNNSVEVIICLRTIPDQSEPCGTLNLVHADRCSNKKCLNRLPHGAPPYAIAGSKAKAERRVWCFRLKVINPQARWICRLCLTLNYAIAPFCRREGCNGGTNSGSAFFIVPLYAYDYTEQGGSRARF